MPIRNSNLRWKIVCLMENRIVMSLFDQLHTIPDGIIVRWNPIFYNELH